MCALSDRAVGMEERAMACCLRGYHVYTLYSNEEYDKPNSARCQSSRSADAIYSGRWNGSGERSFGSGRPSIGFKYRRIDMRLAITFQDPESHENCMHCIRARALFLNIRCNYVTIDSLISML